MNPMDRDQNITAARRVTADAAALLHRSPAFRQLAPATQQAISRDVAKIQQALQPAGSLANGKSIEGATATGTTLRTSHDPYAFPLDTPDDFYRRRRRIGEQDPAAAGNGANSQPASPSAQAGQPDQPTSGAARQAATETIAKRTGALVDEINFPAFVAGLVHGTYDAMVDAAIRQMEAFADLVSAVAKDVDQFTSENVTTNQVYDWLQHQYPRDLLLDVPVGPNAAEPQLHPRAASGDDTENSPAWLADFGLEGLPLTDDLIAQQLVPAAKRKVGENRMQTLATMVLLGMNRINIKDGSISAKVRFRAAASDQAGVIYASGQDPGGQTWAQRGSAALDQHSTMISTVGVNVQADSDLKAELFGEVRINFVSETVPLEKFADSARVNLLQHNSRASSRPPAAVQDSAQPALPPSTSPQPQPVAVAVPVPVTGPLPVAVTGAKK